MKLKFIKEDDLNTIKGNIKQLYKEVYKNKAQTLAEFTDNENIIKEAPYEIDDFQLDISQPSGNESLTDFENIKRVYNHMRFLTDSQASDERIWAAYTLSEFKSYMDYRWPVSNESDIKNRYLFGYSPQRSLFRNGISRLWWIGRFTYDEKRDDPYELTQYLCKEQDYIESICGRNIFNNPIIGKTTLEVFGDAIKEGVKIDRETVRDLGKYVNLISGTYVLDMMSREDIYSKIRKHLNF